MTPAQLPLLVDPPGEKGEVPFDCFSEDRRYRYRLGLRWGPGPLINFLLVNPSIATKDRPDPTWTRCLTRARMLAAAKPGDFSARLIAHLRRRGEPGGVVLTNPFALVSTDPAALYTEPDPIGPENDRHIVEVAQEAAIVICGWGTNGAHLNRGRHVKTMLQDLRIDLYALGFTKDKHPAHPLYLSYDLEPVSWL